MSNEGQRPPRPPKPPRAPIVERARWFQLTEAASVGIEMAAAIGVGAGVGIYLERNVTHWAPWTTYIGLAIGLSAAVLAVIRTARNFTRMIAAEEADEAARASSASSAVSGGDEPADLAEEPYARYPGDSAPGPDPTPGAAPHPTRDGFVPRDGADR